MIKFGITELSPAKPSQEGFALAKTDHEKAALSSITPPLLLVLRIGISAFDSPTMAKLNNNKQCQVGRPDSTKTNKRDELQCLKLVGEAAHFSARNTNNGERQKVWE